MRHNIEDWLAAEADGDQPTDNTSPASAPDAGQPAVQPDVANQAQVQQAADPQQQPTADVTQDPQTPDMPDNTGAQQQDFQTWRGTYLKESRKGDTDRLTELLLQVRERPNLSPEDRKFVDDNWNIQLLRSDANVAKTSRQIRTLVQQQLDRNNPATSLVNHITMSLESVPLLNNVFIKIAGYDASKMDLHRKFIGALLGAVQVSSGSTKPDLLYESKEYSIEISTRFNSRWGDVYLGEWTLRQDDPDHYLSDPELKRLSYGSPEERDALRRRVVMESIAKLYEERSFIISVIDSDGTMHTLGWDISTTLRTAFTSGKLVVKTKPSDSSEAMIDTAGKIVPLVDLSVVFVKQGNSLSQDDSGGDKEEVRFMERRNGNLFLVASPQTVKEVSAVLQGMAYKESPHTGNPSDLKTLQRCIYSAHDLIMRQC